MPITFNRKLRPQLGPKTIFNERLPLREAVIKNREFSFS